jgi:ribonuclease HI
MDKVIIYCDGGCRGNQNKENVGGWGVVLTQGPHQKLLKGYDFNTTNNQMELTGAIKALEAIKRNTAPIFVHCDSAYVVNGMNDWVEGWKKRGWRKADKKPPENVELWKRLDELKSGLFGVQFVKVKGHVGVELNELADQLANEAMDEAMGGI